MHPILYELEIAGRPVLIGAYGICALVGALAGVWLTCRRLKHQGADWMESVSILGVAFPMGVLGALLFGLAYRLLDRAAPAGPGAELHLVWQGGVALGVPAAAVMARRLGRPILDVLDAGAPGLFLGLACGRVGCLLGGCCFGAPTGLPWGIRYPAGHPTCALYPGEAVHPAPVYESLLCLAIVAVTLAAGAPRRRGAVLAGGLLAYAAGRVGLELLRGDHAAAFLGLTAPQLFSLAVAAAVLAAWRFLPRRAG
jgi:phosphatidylglycerol:prolipoprotein diacylglycerol transferase